MSFTKLMNPLVLERIIFYLDQKSLVKFSRTNKHLNVFCLKEKYWKMISLDLYAIRKALKKYLL